MRIHYRRRPPPKPQSQLYRSNEQINVPEVRVIDDEGKFLGVLKTGDAIALAREREFDLVEVSPKENPPVCKILDYGAFKYQKDKETRQQKAHAKKVEVKGIRLSVKMGTHDQDVRKEQALDFLKEGQKLKIEIFLRGREKAHGDIALQRIKDFIDIIGQTYELYTEQEAKRQGGNVSAIVGRKA
ncbi:translation initiation factor IF-3 [Patescibacteria group bacterium]|nr:translation initiation factor IF-3 [Patescibacteria group bacterium]MBU1448244.1 translation initiation factor IF-3 [Patescibacteria group bacterium]MBU2613690.1 translation initiation factor IF-3 [Patescibacteria group bacterium]